MFNEVRLDESLACQRTEDDARDSLVETARSVAASDTRKQRLASGRILSLLITGVLSVAMALGLTGTASARPGPFYWIVAEHSGQALLPLNHSRDSNVEIVQNRRINAGAQNWRIRNSGDYFGDDNRIRRFENRHSRLCISAYDSQPGRVLRQVPCHTVTAHEEWVVSSQNDMFFGRPFTVFNRSSNMCMDVAGASQAEYARIIQWHCNGQANQRFRLIYVDGT